MALALRKAKPEHGEDFLPGIPWSCKFILRAHKRMICSKEGLGFVPVELLTSPAVIIPREFTSLSLGLAWKRS